MNDLQMGIYAERVGVKWSYGIAMMVSRADGDLNDKSSAAA
jgi:hypothetical protein